MIWFTAANKWTKTDSEIIIDMLMHATWGMLVTTVLGTSGHVGSAMQGVCVHLCDKINHTLQCLSGSRGPVVSWRRAYARWSAWYSLVSCRKRSSASSLEKAWPIRGGKNQHVFWIAYICRSGMTCIFKKCYQSSCWQKGFQMYGSLGKLVKPLL